MVHPRQKSESEFQLWEADFEYFTVLEARGDIKFELSKQGFLQALDSVLGNDICDLTNFFDSLFLQFQFLISGSFLPF